MNATTIPGPARLLGFSGLIPFVVLALATVVAPEPWSDRAAGLLVGYGAVILSFMGGCQWGFAAAGLGEGPTVQRLGIAVLPALYAWIVALLPMPQACLALMVGFVALMSWDLKTARRGGTPAWWPALRFPLTAGAAGSLALAGLF